MSRVLQAVIKGDIEALKSALDEGDSVAVVDGKGWTSLHHAMQQTNPDFVALLLLKNDIELNRTDKNGWTPLHHAVFQRREKAISLLLADSRIDENITDVLGYTPLHIAVKHKFVKAVSLLLGSSRINMNVRNNSGTPIELASNEGHKDIIALLFEAGAELPGSLEIALFFRLPPNVNWSRRSTNINNRTDSNNNSLYSARPTVPPKNLLRT